MYFEKYYSNIKDSMTEQQPANLGDGGDNGHAGRHVDARQLERDEEKDDGEKIEKQFHSGFLKSSEAEFMQ